MQIELDWRSFNAAMNRVVEETQRPAADVLKQQAKLLVRDCVQLTPPTGNAPLTESFNAQRKAGERAIKGDINAIFRPLSSLKIMQAASPTAGGVFGLLRQHAQAGQTGLLMDLLRKFGINTYVEAQLTPAIHRNHRSRATGRTLKTKSHHRLIIQERTIETQLRALYARVGKAKSGWLQAARALGVSLPSWISRHSSPGGIDIKLGFETSTIEFFNGVAYAQRHNRTARVMQRAIGRRAESMEHQLNAALGKVFDGYSAK